MSGLGVCKTLNKVRHVETSKMVHFRMANFF